MQLKPLSPSHVRDGDLRVPRDAHVIVLGPRGCGKSDAVDALLRRREIAPAHRSSAVLVVDDDSGCGGDDLNVQHPPPPLQLDDDAHDATAATISTTSATSAYVFRSTVFDAITRASMMRLVRDRSLLDVSVWHEATQCFQVPRAHRQQADVVLLFNVADKAERLRLYRFVASAFFPTRADFYAALDALDARQCLVLRRDRASHPSQAVATYTVPVLDAIDGGARAEPYLHDKDDVALKTADDVNEPEQEQDGSKRRQADYDGQQQQQEEEQEQQQQEEEQEQHQEEEQEQQQQEVEQEQHQQQEEEQEQQQEVEQEQHQQQEEEQEQQQEEEQEQQQPFATTDAADGCIVEPRSTPPKPLPKRPTVEPTTAHDAPVAAATITAADWPPPPPPVRFDVVLVDDYCHHRHHHAHAHAPAAVVNDCNVDQEDDVDWVQIDTADDVAAAGAGAGAADVADVAVAGVAAADANGSDHNAGGSDVVANTRPKTSSLLWRWLGY